MKLDGQQWIDKLPRVATRKQTAAYAHKNVATVDRWISSGEIEAIKIGGATLVLIDSLEAKLRRKRSA